MKNLKKQGTSNDSSNGNNGVTFFAYNNKEIDRKILKSIESPDLYHFIQDKMNLSKLYKNKTVKSCN